MRARPLRAGGTRHHHAVIAARYKRVSYVGGAMLGNHGHRISHLSRPLGWPCYTRWPQLTLPEWSREVGANPTRSRHCKWGAERQSGTHVASVAPIPDEWPATASSGVGRRSRSATIHESGDLANRARPFRLFVIEPARRVVTPKGTDVSHFVCRTPSRPHAYRGSRACWPLKTSRSATTPDPS